jgi:uncharacterized protein YbjT (DUF2867 family)
MTVQSNFDTLVTVFGGSGFVGRHVVRALAKHHYRIRVAVRRPELAGHLQPLGRVGQIHAVQANLRHPGSVAAAVRDADVVINLVGILFERGRQRFEAVQHAGAEAVAKAAALHGARLVHMSALGADADAPSAYARSKAAGEQAVKDAFPTATILRPAIIFGPEDDFFNRFARLATISPFMPLIGGGETRFQPVYVGDVADAVIRALDDPAASGRTYELGGPKIYTFRALMELMLAEIKRKRWFIDLPFGIASLQARLLSILPNPPLTVDQVEMLKRDNVVSSGALTLATLGIEPNAVEAIIPLYLDRFRPGGWYDRRRAVA